MTESRASSLVSFLRSMSLRCRTGIILLSADDIGSEREVAARLGLDAVDYAEEILRGVPSDARFVDISPETDEGRLHALINSTAGANALLVYNFDLALARMERRQRQYLWQSIRDRLAYGRKALLIAMPQESAGLMPPEEDLSAWRADERIVIYDS